MDIVLFHMNRHILQCIDDSTASGKLFTDMFQSNHCGLPSVIHHFAQAACKRAPSTSASSSRSKLPLCRLLCVSGRRGIGGSQIGMASGNLPQKFSKVISAQRKGPIGHDLNIVAKSSRHFSHLPTCLLIVYQCGSDIRPDHLCFCTAEDSPILRGLIDLIEHLQAHLLRDGANGFFQFGILCHSVVGRSRVQLSYPQNHLLHRRGSPGHQPLATTI